jgi:hypothetical protein
MGFKQSKVIGVNVRFIGSSGAGEFQKKPSHHLILSTKGGGQYQGVGMVDKAMVACGLNCLLGSRRVDVPRIPP